MNNKEIKDTKREMNFYLTMAKINKAVSMALYYIGLAAPVAGTIHAFTKDSFGKGLETALAGGIMGAGIIFCAAVMRQTNPQILRDYVNARDRLNTLNNQKVK